MKLFFIFKYYFILFYFNIYVIFFLFNKSIRVLIKYIVGNNLTQIGLGVSTGPRRINSRTPGIVRFQDISTM